MRVLGNAGWNGPQEASSPNSCSKQDHPWGLAWLLSHLIPWLLKTFEDGDSTTSPDNLFTTWLSSWWKTLSFYWVVTSFGQFLPVTSCPPTMHHCSTFLPFFHGIPFPSSAQAFLLFFFPSLLYYLSKSFSCFGFLFLYFNLLFPLKLLLPNTHLPFTLGFLPAVPDYSVTLPILHHI